MGSNRDPFYDDGVIGTEEQPPPIPATRKRLSIDVHTTEIVEDPTATPRSPSPLRPASRSPSPPAHPVIPLQSQTIKEEIHESRSSSSCSSESHSFEEDIDDDEEEEKKKKFQTKIPHGSTADIDIQTDRIAVRDESIQTETNPLESVSKPSSRKIAILSGSKKSSIPPLAKTLFDQTISSALPIISFCQPFSMTSHVNDIILAMPRHIMIINNQNSVSVYPWQQPQNSTSTILECFWCSFLYKLLVTTLEDNRLFIYDFVSVIDSIKLRGHPLSIKHQSYQSKEINSSLLLPSSSSRHQSSPSIWSQTRFTKSNSLGIYYCYISDRHYSCMLTRIDHNTRQHIKAIDCSGGSLNNRSRVCAMGLSDERVAIVLTNLIMTIYHAETLVGLKQLNLSRWHGYNIRGVSAVIYLWNTWLVFDPIENKVVGIGKRKRQFVKMLPEQPVNVCSMDNGTVALWLGYPGAVLYYRLTE
jgi:hypothetical protein